MLDSIYYYNIQDTLKSHFWRKSFIILLFITYYDISLAMLKALQMLAET